MHRLGAGPWIVTLVALLVMLYGSLSVGGRDDRDRLAAFLAGFEARESGVRLRAAALGAALTPGYSDDDYFEASRLFDELQDDSGGGFLRLSDHLVAELEPRWRPMVDAVASGADCAQVQVASAGWRRKALPMADAVGRVVELRLAEASQDVDAAVVAWLGGLGLLLDITRETSDVSFYRDVLGHRWQSACDAWSSEALARLSSAGANRLAAGLAALDARLCGDEHFERFVADWARSVIDARSVRLQLFAGVPNPIEGSLRLAEFTKRVAAAVEALPSLSTAGADWSGFEQMVARLPCHASVREELLAIERAHRERLAQLRVLRVTLAVRHPGAGDLALPDPFRNRPVTLSRRDGLATVEIEGVDQCIRRTVAVPRCTTAR